MSYEEAKRPHSLEANDESQTEEPQPKVSRKTLVEGDMAHRINEIQMRMQKKKEMLRKLNLAKTYRTKWETQDLGALTDQWREVCQTALEDLRGRLKEGIIGDSGQSELTLKTLMNNLGIDPELVRLNEEEDSFIT
ncbi:Swi5-dependent recombination DNA repair protein 1 [Chionoecetes opilio]|uniref:Swi5-dependent recombination DNA repair protein 1 homolog n=1 Tax=Chionoecetes opilio TaxID=41210 RepID=A0A8J5CRL8_CHIOP|nr:Swi5-dependent recombination DNA repair protein 1 [Chionoecetes opilio]